MGLTAKFLISCILKAMDTKVSVKEKSRVCVVGIGYVGLTLAVSMAKHGFNVVGFDKNVEIVNMVNQGISPFYEENFDKHLNEVIKSKKLRASADLTDLERFHIWIITVGTPLKGKEFDTEPLFHLVDKLVPNLRNSDLVILRSTVSLGTTKKIERRIQSQGKRTKIAFCPERTVEGNALTEIKSLPQIIGSDNDDGFALAKEMFEALGVTTLRAHGSGEAEMAKLICNTYRDIQFAFANEIALIGESYGLSAINAIEIARNSYSRSPVADPGPTAGPCLVKDGVVFGFSSRIGNTQSLGITARSINREVAKWPSRIIGSEIIDSDRAITIVILGLAFKGEPPTSDIRDSLAIDIQREILNDFPQAKVFGWDPVANSAQIEASNFNWIDLSSAIDKSDFLIMQNNHIFFSSFEFKNLLGKYEGTIIDFWRLVPTNSSQKIYRFGETRDR